MLEANDFKSFRPFVDNATCAWSKMADDLGEGWIVNNIS